MKYTIPYKNTEQNNISQNVIKQKKPTNQHKCKICERNNEKNQNNEDVIK